jgi:hypothetical protein
MRAISASGVSIEIPMTPSACAQNGCPWGTPIASKRRILRRRLIFAVASSMAWMMRCCTGSVKVVA